MKKQISPKITAITFGVLVILFSTAFYIFAWIEPSIAPPGGNVDTPINTGGDNQTKIARISATEFGDANDSSWYIDINYTGNRTSFFTNNSEKVSILSNGNVGIGINNPQSPLHIKASSNKNIRLEEDGAGTAYFDIGVNNDGFTESLEIHVGNNLTPALTIWDLFSNGSDLVGIGTATPAARLDIVGDENPLVRLSGFTNPEIVFVPTTAGTAWGIGVGTLVADEFSIRDTQSGITAMHIKTNGNIGIGDTTTVNSKLQISGGYLQIDYGAASPVAADCNETTETGRMFYEDDANKLWICDGVSGWKSVNAI